MCIRDSVTIDQIKFLQIVSLGIFNICIGYISDVDISYVVGLQSFNGIKFEFLAISFHWSFGGKFIELEGGIMFGAIIPEENPTLPNPTCKNNKQELTWIP